MATLEKKITVDELIEYYKQHNITDYPKTTNGLPKMNSKINKDAIHKINESKKDIKPNDSDINCPNLDKENTCSICSEPFNGKCILSCNHTFCVSCAISHFRVNNTCPLCRHVICDKPKKHEKMPGEMVDQNIENILMSEEEESRQYMTMKNYLLKKLDFYKTNNILNKERYVDELCDEVIFCLYDYNSIIEQHYC